MAVLQVAVQQQGLNQGLGALGLAERVFGRGPERFMGGSEGALVASRIERLGAGQGAGLGPAGQEVIQHHPFGALGRQAGWRAISVRP
ncbi:hypothetical protein ACIP39_11875 [Streptomyces tibetensis]|uniref:hypothetical protein n=1 Tax=Streptomyces tibetensis TaxID=2382123 RepID=UPI00380790DF